MASLDHDRVRRRPPGLGVARRVVPVGRLRRCCSSPPPSTTSTVRCSASSRRISSARSAGASSTTAASSSPSRCSYAVMMLFWGRILDRIGTKLGLAIAVAWWSLAAMGTAFARSAMGFGAARFLLGVGEAANFPASIKTVAEWFPKSERAFATGIFNAGTNIGAVRRAHRRAADRRDVGLAGRVHPDRRARVRLAGRLVGAVQPGRDASAASVRGARVHPRRARRADHAKRRRCRACLGTRQLWAFAMGKLLTDPIWWFYLFWLPKFLAQEHGIRGVALIPYLTTVYIVADVGSVVGGYLSSALIKRGWTVNAARKTTMGHFRGDDSRGHHRAAGEERVGGGRLDQPGHIVPPGVVGEHVHAGVGHVSASRGRNRRRLRRLRGRHRRHPDRGVRRPRAASGSELLPADVHRRRPRVFVALAVIQLLAPRLEPAPI